MQSSLISKIEKAHRYAAERHRMKVDALHLSFHGDNGDYEVAIEGEQWSCTCDFFAGWRICSHTMALERIMAGMVPELPLGSTQLVPA